jgi:hypothetical protein
MTIFLLNYYHSNEEPNICGFFDDYHLAYVQMEVLKESFALSDRKYPKFSIEEYVLNDTSGIESIIEMNVKYSKK